ncbi:MAG: hypothetical protein JSS30_00295 [Verrucomicrobia bacterium]|nr:hypothetical protein [Verrucomicrobiota bacterium]
MLSITHHGIKYEGQFDNTGLINGKATHPDGTVWKGSFENNVFRGTITYTDGTTYKGECVNNQYHGQGVLTHAKTNIVFEGTFKKGELISGCLYDLLKNSTYRGGFKNFRPHGQGELISPSGNSVKGEFLPNGEILNPQYFKRI